MENCVKIAGAGISGLTCAINLCKMGHRVIIFEKRNEVGARFNNDFQGLENWSSEEDVLSMLKRIGLDIDFYWKGFKEAHLITDLSQEYRIRSLGDRHAIYMIKRGTESDSLDQRLKEQAIKIGVDIRFNMKVKEDDVDIWATGPISASGIVYGLKGNVDSEDMIVIMMDDLCAPKGYVYMAILDHRITLATVVMKDLGRATKCLEEAKEKLTKFYGLEIKGLEYFGGFGNFFLKESYCHGGKVYIGEAAGLQDYLFGFGMRYAFISGYLASESITKNVDYDTLIERELSSIMKSSLVNRHRYEKLGNVGYRMLIKRWAEYPDPLEYLRAWYKLTWIKKCIYPVSKKWYKKKTRLLALNNLDKELNFLVR
jgi:flavin-dependent dehydrogenase